MDEYVKAWTSSPFKSGKKPPCKHLHVSYTPDGAKLVWCRFYTRVNCENCPSYRARGQA